MSILIKGVLRYYVENAVTHERRTAPDCEKWAEEYARTWNEKEQESQ